MFKKLLVGSFALTVALTASVGVFAQTNESELNVYSQELVSPLGFDVRTGETLNLRIFNKSDHSISFEVPLMSISVDLEKNSKTVVPINFSNPADKDIWFIIKQEGSNNKTGTFKVTDYSIKVPTSDVNSIDTSALKDIINYDTTFVYEDKPEPIYRTTPVVQSYEPLETPIYAEPEPAPAAVEPAPVKTGGYVRGYW
ncbi:MAG: hypothetical protein AB7V50_02245 [Vampirovibrionia bacterium]